MADAPKGKAGLPEPVELETSNHNSLSPVKPVGVARVAEMGDYNPMRREPNKANIASDTTNTRETAKALVDEKGDRPYRANVEANAATVADTAVVSDVHRAGAIAASEVAAAEPDVYKDRLPADVSADVVPAVDAGDAPK